MLGQRTAIDASFTDLPALATTGFGATAELPDRRRCRLVAATSTSRSRVAVGTSEIGYRWRGLDQPLRGAQGKQARAAAATAGGRDGWAGQAGARA